MHAYITGAPALIRMGAWEVRALSCTESGEEEEELTTLEGFCRGHFCYSVLLRYGWIDLVVVH